MNNVNQFFGGEGGGGGLRIYLRLPKVVFAIRGKVGINHKDLRTKMDGQKCMFSVWSFQNRNLWAVHDNIHPHSSPHENPLSQWC